MRKNQSAKTKILRGTGTETVTGTVTATAIEKRGEIVTVIVIVIGTRDVIEIGTIEIVVGTETVIGVGIVIETVAGIAETAETVEITKIPKGTIKISPDDPVAGESGVLLELYTNNQFLTVSRL